MKNARILVIDDDQWLVDEYARTLTAAGYTVERAGNAVDAMETIDRLKPNVIILDLFMPGPNGIVLLHEIKSHTDLSRIPIILISNAASDLKPDVLVPYGVLKVLDKTAMVPGDIVAAVKRVL